MPATNALLQEGRYRINSENGPAGSAAVYDAFDTVSETNVVVKEIPGKLNKVATLTQREAENAAFANAAKTLTGIEHDSLLGVRDFFSEIGRQYLVLESVEGDDLQTLLENKKIPFSVAEVTAWADQLLDGLQYLHSYKTPIVHRSIRPSNIKVVTNGKVKLMGFGQAAGDGSPDGPGIVYSPLEQMWQGLDAASQKVITNKYDERSERILKEDLDARSDIYSLGATLYHLITGRTPVDALERSIEIIEGGADPLLAPNRIDPGIPPEVSDVVIKAMEIKREYRFDSAAIMRQVLKTALVRVKEREAEEAREQEEAANDIRLAAERKQSSAVPAETAPPPPLVEELKADKSEADPTTIAESRQEQPTIPAALLDDDLLGLLDSPVHVSEAPAGKLSAIETSPSEAEDKPSPQTAASADAPVEDSPSAVETDSFVRHGDATDTAGLPADESVAREEEEPDQEQVDAVVEKIFLTNGDIGEEVLYDSPVEEPDVEAAPTLPEQAAVEPSSASETAAPAREVAEQQEPFTIPQEPASGLGIAAKATGAVVLIIIAAGIYMLMSSGSQPAKTAAVEPTVTSQPSAADAPAQSAFQQNDVPASAPSETAPETGTESEQTAVKPVTAAAVKPKKAPAAAPAKTPPPKKAITADDLINDN